MNGYSAYAKSQNVVESAREVEYRLIGQVTAALIEAQESTDATKRVDAVLWNRQIWSAFRVDLMDPNNALPKPIRAQLISLSLWVDRETHAVLDKKSDMSALIEINKSIMEGLKR